jgi:hypothetical protein
MTNKVPCSNVTNLTTPQKQPRRQCCTEYLENAHPENALSLHLVAYRKCHLTTLRGRVGSVFAAIRPSVRK